MSETEKLQCYNKGCLKLYSQEEDTDGACVHHPGAPVFHDAMKGWSCCKKRSTDFTDFLNIPGCTVGMHNPVKPPEPEKVKEKPLAVGEEIIVKAPLPKENRKTPRPSNDVPMVQLKVKVSNSLKSLLARLKKQEAVETKKEVQETETDDRSDSEGIEIGTVCKNKGCQSTYYGSDTELTTCRHHPGVAIFHEGYKFWTCCQRRTSDFDEFLRQEGCTAGEHKWIETEKKEVSCRYDWHQTGTQVVISFYAKACVPETCHFEANPTSTRILLSFDNGKTQQLTEFKLYGVIDIERSAVELLGTKVELKLRKADPLPWATLELKTRSPPHDDKPKSDE